MRWSEMTINYVLKRLTKAHLRHTCGDVRAAAKGMQVSRATVYKWIKDMDIDLEGIRREASADRLASRCLRL